MEGVAGGAIGGVTAAAFEAESLPVFFNACSSCNYNYGEYIVDMETYLEAALQYKEEVQEDYCNTCNQCYEWAAEQAENDDGNQEENDEAWRCDGMDTDTCYAECQNIEDMEENGYMDASEFVECQQLDIENDDDGDNQLYAGAMCASSGTRIKIKIFSDEECSNYEEGLDIESYLKNGDGYNLKLSYHLLKQTFAEGECISDCLVEEEQNPNEQPPRRGTTTTESIASWRRYIRSRTSPPAR